MNKTLSTIVMILVAGLSLTSCLSNDDDTNIEYTRDTAITAFSLGSMKQHSKTTAGKDTVLTDAVTGSAYTFYIDQTTREIYNPDSLPAGTDASAVLATITAKESSIIYLMDSVTTDSIVAYYSSSDSIDFSMPRYLRVYNNAYTAYVTYKVTVNIHQEEADSFAWATTAQADASLAALSAMRGVELGGSVYLFGKQGNEAKIYKTASTDGASWTAVTPNVALSADAYKNVVAFDGKLYVLNNGTLLASTDAETWTTVAAGTSLTQLIGTSSQYLYAYSATGIAVSKDHGQTWTVETLDADITSLPTESVCMGYAGIKSTADAENMLLLGMRASSYADSIATVWTHLTDYDTHAGTSKWNLVEYEARQAYKLPSLDQIDLTLNDSGYVAMGSNGKCYRSKDGGLSWHVDSAMLAPTAFDATAHFAFFRTADKKYWIVNNGNVWKGYFKKDAWKEN